MTSKKIVLATLATALVATAAVPALAAPGFHRPGERGVMRELMFVRLLKTADTNKDGKVSKEEVTARQDALFTQIDANKDDILTPGELRTFRKASIEEFRKNNPRPERAENREERREQRMAERDGDHRDDRRDRGWRRHEMRHGGPMMGLRLVRMADTDENGQFSKAEVSAAVDKLFARMDRNKDGIITIDDMPDRPL
ncbi:hypothetical protein [Rhizobium sp. LCM 4573]|uniref:hypothetical protein n=1 Tax=Rhizobium sp. LCM 4573 TaxID=1848291 RepID=UPI0008DA7A45|nr:hypothetical protein [Rhizobium sp. LCM 4573]OHV83728.1 hypothetical protein LCM4573_06390 [Rhizobium sp. LCM 4573]